MLQLPELSMRYRILCSKHRVKVFAWGMGVVRVYAKNIIFFPDMPKKMVSVQDLRVSAQFLLVTVLIFFSRTSVYLLSDSTILSKGKPFG